MDDGLLFREPDSPAVLSTGGGRHWPEGRGVVLLPGRRQVTCGWINEEEHFKLMVAPWRALRAAPRIGPCWLASAGEHQDLRMIFEHKNGYEMAGDSASTVV